MRRIQDSTDAGRDAPVVDAGLDPADAPTIDSGMPVDGAPLDAPPLDAPLVDAPPIDAALVDAPLVDAPLVDAPSVDAPLVDAPLVDAPAIDAGPPPTSCADVLARGLGSVDGPYTISPDGVATFTVYCDMTTAGGGWTLILNKLGDFPWSGWTRQTTTAATPHLRASASPLADNQDLLAGIPGTRLMFVTGERGLTSRAVLTPDLGASFRTFYDSVWGVSGRWCGRAPTGTSAFELLFDGAVLDCYERAAPEGDPAGAGSREARAEALLVEIGAGAAERGAELIEGDGGGQVELGHDGDSFAFTWSSRLARECCTKSTSPSARAGRRSDRAVDPRGQRRQRILLRSRFGVSLRAALT